VGRQRVPAAASSDVEQAADASQHPRQRRSTRVRVQCDGVDGEKSCPRCLRPCAEGEVRATNGRSHVLHEDRLQLLKSVTISFVL
jgi:hypothetical protein